MESVITTVRLPKEIHLNLQKFASRNGKLHGRQKKAFVEAINLWVARNEGTLVIVDDGEKRYVEAIDNIDYRKLPEIDVEPVLGREFTKKQLFKLAEIMRKFAEDNNAVLKVKVIEVEGDKVTHEFIEVDPAKKDDLRNMINSIWKNRRFLKYADVVVSLTTKENEKIELGTTMLTVTPSFF